MDLLTFSHSFSSFSQFSRQCRPMNAMSFIMNPTKFRNIKVQYLNLEKDVQLQKQFQQQLQVHLELHVCDIFKSFQVFSVRRKL